jgi:hypothetical protein
MAMTKEQLQAIAIAKARMAAEQAQAQPSTAEDIARSGLAGVEKGFGGLADFPVMAGRGLAKGVMYGADKAQQLFTGEDPNRRAGVPSPFAGEFTNAVTANVPGANYEPQTTAGQYAETVGEFAPNALAPGGIARKAAMVAVPGLASETAGQLTKGSAFETPARVVGGLAGGIASASNYGKQVTRIVKKAAAEAGYKSGPEMRQAINAAYTTLKDAGVKYDGLAYTGMVHAAKEAITKSPASIAPKANGLLDDLAKQPLLNFGDLDAQSSAVGKALRAANRAGDEAEAAALSEIKGHLDEFAVNPKIVTDGTATLSPPVLRDMRTAARKMALRNKKAELIEGALEDADSYSGGFLNGLNQQLGSLLRNKKTADMFTKSEKALLQSVMTGKTPLANLGLLAVDMAGFGGGITSVGGLMRGVGTVAGNPILRNRVKDLGNAFRSEGLDVATRQAQKAAREAASRRYMGILTGSQAGE